MQRTACNKRTTRNEKHETHDIKCTMATARSRPVWPAMRPVLVQMWKW
jgi:hypothetical protein